MKIHISEKAVSTIKKSLMITLFSILFVFALTFVFDINISLGAVYNIYVNSSDGAVVTNFTFVLPINNSIHFESDNFTINVTTNNSFEQCDFSMDLNGTWYEMANISTTNMSFSNASAINELTFPQLMSGDWHNITFHCQNSTSYHTWTNDTLFRVQLKGNADYGISILFPTNATSYIDPQVNISVDDGANNCSIVIGATATTLTSYGGRTFYTNSSALTWGEETEFGLWHNFTFFCYDAVGNKSYYNATDITVATDWRKIKIDTLSPVISNISYTILNKTDTGNFMNVTFSVDDNSSVISLSVRVIYDYNSTDGGNIYNASSETYIARASASEDAWVNVTLPDIEENGHAILEIYATDDVQHVGKGGTNYTAQIWRLKTGWNYYQGFDNATLTQIASHVPNVSYVATFNNMHGNKSWITFTTGGSTNADIVANTTNVTAIYVTQDVLFIREGYANTITHIQGTEVVEFYHNSSTTSGWNIIGMMVPTTLNKTLWGPTIGNLTNNVVNESINFTANDTYVATNQLIISITSVTNQTDTVDSGNYTYIINSTGSFAKIVDTWDEYNTTSILYNISYVATGALAYTGNTTWACYYDTQLGKFCCSYRSRRANTCAGYYSGNYTIPRGGVAYIYSKGVNFTYNRTDVYTVGDYR